MGTLTISRKGRTHEYELDPSGVILGRSPDCGLVLDSGRVSRQHARIFQDPFGRWIIEDLGSRNGVQVSGQRVRAHAMLPGEPVIVGPFVLRIEAEIEEPNGLGPMETSTRLLQGKADMNVESAVSSVVLSQTRLRELNEAAEVLARLPDASGVYAEACKCLTRTGNRAALVLRLPTSDLPLREQPSVLACALPGGAEGGSTAIHLSHRVLEATRRTAVPVLARSAPTDGAELSLTILDRRQPRAVLCTQVTCSKRTLDVFYLDLPTEEVAPDSMDFFHAMARQVGLIRRGLLLGELRAERSALERELSRARDIQRRLTPSRMPQLPGIEVAVCYEPAMWVGGDYCDVWLLPDSRLAFAIGDVCGKGLPAALVMANLQSALRTATAFSCDAAKAVAQVNTHLNEHLPDGMFVTLFLGFLDAEDGKLEYVNAGHEPPFIVVGRGQAARLGQPTAPLLGVVIEPMEVATEVLPAGSLLLAVTDGVTESASAEGKLFTAGRLMQLLSDLPVCSACETVESVSGAARAFRCKGSPHDDMTVLAVMRRQRA